MSVKSTDRIMRAIAFYASVALFLVLLPIVLSYSLGYRIDYRNLKIYKTGILYISSRPAGAAIYLNGNKHYDVTPAQIEELKPGTYRVVVSREGFYPWERELVVRPNMATKADRIVLFPVKQDMKKMGERGVVDFVVSDNGYIYYMKKSGLYRSTMDGQSMKRISSYSEWPENIAGKRFSPAQDKFLFFSDSKIWVVTFDYGKKIDGSAEEAKVEEVFAGQDPVTDVFWYPGSGYLIVVTDKDIEVSELRSGAARNVVVLYKFNAKPQGLSYDEAGGALYFIDTGLGKDFTESKYLYRIDLKQKFFDQIFNMLLKKEPDSGYEKRQAP